MMRKFNKNANKFVYLNLLVLFFISPAYGEDKLSQRIVSIDPSVTEEIYMLGAGDRLKGSTIYCKRPEEAKNNEKIGTFLNVNLEKIVSINPDIIFNTPLTDRRAIKKLKSLGFRLVEFSQPKDFSQVCDQFLKIGEILGNDKKAWKIVDLADNNLNKIKNAVKNLNRKKVFVQVGAKPLFTVNKDSFINDLINLAGGRNIGQDSKKGIFSREEVIRNNPDCIIITAMGIAGEDEKRTWQKFKNLRAVKNDNIYIFDAERLCSPNPVTFVDLVTEFALILHPNLEI